VLAAAEVAKTAATALEVVADLIDLLHGDHLDVAHVFAAALVAEAAAALFVVVALLVDGVCGVGLWLPRSPAGAAAGGFACWLLLGFGFVGETGLVLSVGEAALVTVLARAVVPEVEALSSRLGLAGLAGAFTTGLAGGGFLLPGFLGGETGIVRAVFETAGVTVRALPVVPEVLAHTGASAPALTGAGAFGGLLLRLHVLAEALVPEGATSPVEVLADLVGDVAFPLGIEARVVLPVHETAPVSFSTLTFLEFEALARGGGRDLDGFAFTVFETAFVTITASTIVSEVAANFLSFGHVVSHCE